MSLFRNWSLNRKITALVLFMLAGTVWIGSLAGVALQYVSTQYAHIAEVTLPESVAAANLARHFLNAEVDILQLAQDGLSKEEKQSAAKELTKDLESLGTDLKNLNLTQMESEEKVLFELLGTQLAEFIKSVQKVERLVALNDPLKNREMVGILNEVSMLGHKVEGAIDKVLEYQEVESKSWVTKASNAKKMSYTLMLAFFLVTALVCLTVGTYFSRAIIKNLHAVAQQLSTGAEQVAAAGTQIAASSNDVSSAATEQAAAIEQTAASIEEMSSMVKSTAENAQKSRDVANESHTSAKEGEQVVGEMIQAMNDIDHANTEIMNQVESSNKEISDITRVIAEITNKTKVINDIVFQTKLLSFNASVEAARAGDHGKGFAVVAEEVGNLAQMSGNAAKEISGMLDDSAKKVEQIVSLTRSRVEGLMQTGKQRVETGIQVANRCAEVLGGLVKGVNEVHTMMGEISTAAAEQSNGVQEINKAIGQLSEATQQNSSSSTQAASAARMLSDQAERLRTSVSELMFTLNGTSKSGGSKVFTAPKVVRSKAVKNKNVKKPVEARRESAKPQAPKAAAETKNVVAIQDYKAKKETHEPTVASVAVDTLQSSTQAPILKTGTDSSSVTVSGVPSADDPRFMDV